MGEEHGDSRAATALDSPYQSRAQPMGAVFRPAVLAGRWTH